MEAHDKKATDLALARLRHARTRERIEMQMMAAELDALPVGSRLAAQHVHLSCSVSPIALAAAWNARAR